MYMYHVDIITGFSPEDMIVYITLTCVILTFILLLSACSFSLFCIIICDIKRLFFPVLTVCCKTMLIYAEVLSTEMEKSDVHKGDRVGN